MTTYQLELAAFADPALAEAPLTELLKAHDAVARPRLAHWMGYYRNELTPLGQVVPAGASGVWSVRPYRQYQEAGLPGRITGMLHCGDGGVRPAGTLDQQRKEVVIENDLAWRMNTLVDFAAGEMPRVSSTAADPSRRLLLTGLLQGLLEASGGAALLQTLTLLGAVQGSAYLQIKAQPQWAARLSSRPETGGELAGGSADVARQALRLEVLGADRVLAIRTPGMALEELAYAVIRSDTPRAEQRGLRGAAAGGVLGRVGRWLSGEARQALRSKEPDLDISGFELWGPSHWQRYDGGRLVDEATNPWGRAPVVAFINQIVPPSVGGGANGSWAGGLRAGLHDGQSEIEPLLGLQDELNTRLSDRANRVTLQSFRMYLARGLEDFISRPVGPGQMWATDNPQASIETFGGDAECPGETAHIAEVREALDKISGVPPVAAGLLRARLGNLTSAVALRITLIALLARTQKRRAALERTLRSACRQMLEVLDQAGLVRTSAEERQIDVNWPSPLPENVLEKLQEARAKLDVGVPRTVVLRELGYEELVIDSGAAPEADDQREKEPGDGRGDDAGQERGGAGGEAGGAVAGGDAGGGERANVGVGAGAEAGAGDAEPA